MQHRGIVLSAVLVALASACGSSTKHSAPPSTAASTSAAPATTSTTTAAAPLRVLVTNDDGVAADGIDAIVEALRKQPDTSVTVVAPADNQSGQGSALTTGTLTVTPAHTKSGYAAEAVHGHPADTIVWAIDRHGIPQRPDLVVAGINNGQNLGRFVDISGTIGAARAAAQRGIPALAVSQGLGSPPDYASGVAAALAWIARHRAELVAHRATATVTNLNIPTCVRGAPHAVVVTGVAPASANAFAAVDCVTPHASPENDVDGFVHGYTVETDNLPLRPAA